MSWNWDVTGNFPEPWPLLKVTTCVWWLAPLMEGNQSTWKSMRCSCFSEPEGHKARPQRSTHSLVNFKDVRRNHVPCSAWVEGELALFYPTQATTITCEMTSTRVSAKICSTMEHTVTQYCRRSRLWDRILQTWQHLGHCRQWDIAEPLLAAQKMILGVDFGALWFWSSWPVFLCPWIIRSKEVKRNKSLYCTFSNSH